MRLPLKLRYAFACLFELDRRFGEDVTAEAIATVRKIPIAYAQKILQALSRRGIIESKKGAGYRATKRLGNITALEVIRIDEQTPTWGPGGAGDALQRRLEQALAETTLDKLVE